MKIVTFCFFLLTASVSLSAQNATVWFNDGLLLEKEFKINEALAKYELVIQKNNKHPEALIHASRMLSNIGGRLDANQTEDKRKYFEKAESYAVQAIKLDQTNTHARMAHIISLGLLSEISRNVNEKISDAKLIHSEAKTILALDSLFAEAYFVLGKWQLELSSLTWLELFACKIFFGGLPEEVSKQSALAYFNKGLTLKPESILFLFGQASAYFELGEKNQAISVLEKALKLPLTEPDDEQRQTRCRKLLTQIQK